MRKTRIILALTAVIAFLPGCAGHVMDCDVCDVIPSTGYTELEEEAFDVKELAAVMAEKRELAGLQRFLVAEKRELDLQRSLMAEKQELDDLQRSFAEVAAELETMRLPYGEQMTVVNSLAGLPTPSEIASLPPPGPLEDEAYESLTRAAEAYQSCASVHADNLANLETTAFKRRQPVLEECIGDSHGCRIAEIRTDIQQGAFNQTNRNLDVAIEGQGFFILLDPSTGETQYSRAGNFAIDARGQLVLGADGRSRIVQPPIAVPKDSIDIIISPQGNVSVRQPGSQSLANVGQLNLARFVNPEGLLRLGENLFAETDASGKPTTGPPVESGMGVLRQGALEGSNVEPLTELVALTRYLRMLRVMRWLLLAGHPESDLDIYYNAMSP